MERVVAAVGGAMTARPRPPAPRIGAGNGPDGGGVEGVLMVVTPGECGPALAPDEFSFWGWNACGGDDIGAVCRWGGGAGDSTVLLIRRPRAPPGTGGRAGPGAG